MWELARTNVGTSHFDSGRECRRHINDLHRTTFKTGPLNKDEKIHAGAWCNSNFRMVLRAGLHLTMAPPKSSGVLSLFDQLVLRHCVKITRVMAFSELIFEWSGYSVNLAAALHSRTLTNSFAPGKQIPI